MTADLLLSLDQGTTNTKAGLFDRQGEPVFRASVPVRLLQPRAGFVEQDPLELWDSVRDAALRCAAHARSIGASIAGIAIANQRETALAWHAETLLPLAPAVSWQCRRSAALCGSLAPHHGLIRRTSGLPVDPLLTAGKWSWLLQHEPSVQAAAAAGTLRLGTVDAWLLACLTGLDAHRTDPSNASRTALLDLRTLAWSREIASLFAIPLAALPAVQPTASRFGVCASIPELAGVPIVALIGDSHAATAGHGLYLPGGVKATYGTGSSLMTLTATLGPDTAVLARTVAWSVAGHTQYALEGNIAMTGSALQWVGEFLHLPHPAADAAALAATVPDAAGLHFVPARVGLGSPHGDAAARGSITGLERSHTSAHLARAAIEAIAHQVADVFAAMEDATGTPLPALRADGGATPNDSLLHFQAGILGRPVLRSANEDLSLLGAAALGGITLGWWSSLEEFSRHAGSAQTFSPVMPAAERLERRRGWRQAVARTRSEAS